MDFKITPPEPPRSRQGGTTPPWKGWELFNFYLLKLYIPLEFRPGKLLHPLHYTVYSLQKYSIQKISGLKSKILSLYLEFEQASCSTPYIIQFTVYGLQKYSIQKISDLKSKI